MADFKALFTDPDFAAYQNEIVDVVVSWLHGELVKGEADTVRNGMMLAERILSIPTQLDVAPDVKKRLLSAVSARLIEIPSKLFRKEMFDK